MYKPTEEQRKEMANNPEFRQFGEKARKLEVLICDLMEREGCADLRMLAAALGPLLARAMAHLGPMAKNGDPEALIRDAFTQLCDISIEHYNTCVKPHGGKAPITDIYAPPSPHTH